MKKKKTSSKLRPISQSPKCPVCGLASEVEGQFCQSCTGIHQQLVDIVLKRSAMIRYAPLHFYEAICLYRIWLRENKWKKLLKRADVIADWLDENKYNKAEKEKYWDLHVMFIEFVALSFTSQAEEKVEERFRVLEKR